MPMNPFVVTLEVEADLADPGDVEDQITTALESLGWRVLAVDAQERSSSAEGGRAADRLRALAFRIDEI